MSSESKCKGCGNPILWARSPNGRMIPMDPKPVVYKIQGGNAYPQPREVFVISHFITCKDRDQFSNKNPGGTD